MKRINTLSATNFVYIAAAIMVVALCLYARTYSESIIAQPQQGNTTEVRSNVIDLLNQTAFKWNTINYVTLSQAEDKLDINVATDNNNKIYNRAYMQTQLGTQNATQEQIQLQDIPLVLSLDYVAESLEGSAQYVVEVLNQNNPAQHVTAILTPTSSGTGQQSLARETLVLEDMLNKPLEFRLYVITDEPGSHILAIENATIATNSTTDATMNIPISAIANAGGDRNSNLIASLDAEPSINNTSHFHTKSLGPWPFMGKINPR